MRARAASFGQALTNSTFNGASSIGPLDCEMRRNNFCRAQRKKSAPGARIRPNCRATGSTNDKCLCDTCNNANADPCETNADCPPSGGNPGICGGRRCLGSANAGAPCTVGSECPGGVCSRPGEPTRPSACFDDTATANRDLECVDADGNGVGECTVGPLDQRCALASGHGQRFCATDADCGGGPGSCETIQRSCFPTGGGTFQTLGQNDGTDTLAATGMADPATRDQSHPTLVSLSCLPPTGAAVIDTSEGLPGPARRSVKANITVHP